LTRFGLTLIGGFKSNSNFLQGAGGGTNEAENKAGCRLAAVKEELDKKMAAHAAQ
jgi:hypothetical protein